jgi:hypothetical protein
MQKLVFLSMVRAEDFLKSSESFRFDFSFQADRFGPADLEIYEDLELLKVTGWIAVDGVSGLAGQQAPGTPAATSPDLTIDSLVDEVTRGPAPLPEAAEEEELSFEYLMGEDTEEEGFAEVEREHERRYEITTRGIDGLRQIRESTNKSEKFEQLARLCRDVKQQFGDWPLSALLKHVYEQFPAYTTQSEIKDRVLGR